MDAARPAYPYGQSARDGDVDFPPVTTAIHVETEGANGALGPEQSDLPLFITVGALATAAAWIATAIWLQK